MPKLVDLVVARRVLLDVGVAAGQVRLGLVVVEVADEVLDRVVGEEVPELAVELGGERLVVRQHERRLLDPGYHLTTTENVLPVPVAPSRTWCLTPLEQPLGQAIDGLGLVTGRLEVGDQFEVGHRLLGRGSGGSPAYHPRRTKRNVCSISASSTRRPLVPPASRIHRWSCPPAAERTIGSHRRRWRC